MFVYMVSPTWKEYWLVFFSSAIFVSVSFGTPPADSFLSLPLSVTKGLTAPNQPSSRAR